MSYGPKRSDTYLPLISAAPTTKWKTMLGRLLLALAVLSLTVTACVRHFEAESPNIELSNQLLGSWSGSDGTIRWSIKFRPNGTFSTRSIKSSGGERKAYNYDGKWKLH